MKKTFFSIMAIALLSTAAVFASGKPDSTKTKSAATCASGCPKAGGCQKGAVCPSMPGCVCK